jgi:hypothetical protein
VTPTVDSLGPAGVLRRHLPEIGFVAASIIWIGTALVPLSLLRRTLRGQRTFPG